MYCILLLGRGFSVAWRNKVTSSDSNGQRKNSTLCLFVISNLTNELLPCVTQLWHKRDSVTQAGLNSNTTELIEDESGGDIKNELGEIKFVFCVRVYVRGCMRISWLVKVICLVRGCLEIWVTVWHQISTSDARFSFCSYSGKAGKGNIQRQSRK